MISKYVCIAVFMCAVLAHSVAALEESSLVKSMIPGPFILPSPEGTWTWGMAPIYDDEGKVHVFNSVIPKTGTWSKHSKIVHWVADKPEGPYTLLGDVFASDSAAYHNPQISKVDNTFVLVFLLNHYKDENGSKQEVGIATAKSLMGPWIESPHNPILKATPQNGQHASNPTFVVAPSGEFRIYHKTMTSFEGEIFREISLATSSTIEGPYKVSEKGPVISYAQQKVDIEDPYAFYYNNMYYMILEDRQDVSALLAGKHTGEARKGGWRPGLLYKSKDGMDWSKPTVAYKTNETYYGHKLARSERPSILWKNGKPDYLFIACHDDDTSAGYILKINGWEGE